MKYNSRKHRLKPSKLALIVFVGLLFCVVLLVVLEKTGVTDLLKAPSSPNQTNDPTKEEQEKQTAADAKAKQDYLDSVTKSNTSSGTDTSSEPSSQTTNSGSLTVTTSQSGNSVTVLTQIKGISAGTCKLKVTNGAANTTQNAQVIYQPEFSSCAGFSVPVSGIGAGSWNISVFVTPDSGTVLTNTTTLEVK